MLTSDIVGGQGHNLGKVRSRQRNAHVQQIRFWGHNRLQENGRSLGP